MKAAFLAAALTLAALPAFAEDARLGDGTPVWEFFAACAGAGLHERGWAKAQGQDIESNKGNRVYLWGALNAKRYLDRDRGRTQAHLDTIRAFAEREAGALAAADAVKTSLQRPSWMRFIACEAMFDDVQAKKTTPDAIVMARGGPPLKVD